MDYGQNVIDNDWKIVGNFVSLETSDRSNIDIGGDKLIPLWKSWIVYDNVVIEDILSDEEYNDKWVN